MHYCSKFSNCIKVTIMLLLVFQRFFSYLYQADGNKKQYYYYVSSWAHYNQRYSFWGVGIWRQESDGKAETASSTVTTTLYSKQNFSSLHSLFMSLKWNHCGDRQCIFRPGSAPWWLKKKRSYIMYIWDVVGLVISWTAACDDNWELHFSY